MRQENLRNDFAAYLRRHEVMTRALEWYVRHGERANTSQRERDYTVYYDHELRHAVEEADDTILRKFEYGFESSLVGSSGH